MEKPILAYRTTFSIPTPVGRMTKLLSVRTFPFLNEMVFQIQLASPAMKIICKLKTRRHLSSFDYDPGVYTPYYNVLDVKILAIFACKLFCRR